MVVDSAPPSDRKALIIGWAFSLAFSAHGLLGVILPRLEKESAIREAGRGWHYFLGFLIAILAILLLRKWYRAGFVIAPGTVSPGTRAWHGLIAIFLAIVPLLAVPLGLLNAWGEGLTVHLAGLVDLPTLMAQDRAIWQFSGYFHSGLGLTLTLVSMIGLLSAGYSYLRYRKGLFSAFPPGIGFLLLVKTILFVYAVNSFSERETGYIAAGIALAIIGLVWVVGRRIGAASPRVFPSGKPGMRQYAAGGGAIGAAVLLAMYMPYLLFKVTPFATGVKIEADPEITWHREPVANVELTEPTEFEETVAMETYKWCEFCHTVKAGARPLVGPNLHNIFGQKAGTVPNFYYSKAMAKAGQEGLVWNDETLDALLADPEGFVPGTSMRISSGPVTDPEVRKAVINILKRRTMGSDGN